MVGVVGALALLAVVALNTAIAALATRFFRVRLRTAWGSLLYAVVLTPIVLFPVTMVALIALESVGVTPNLGSPATVLAVTVFTPLAIGITIDYFWMPAPEVVDLPDTDA